MTYEDLKKEFYSNAAEHETKENSDEKFIKGSISYYREEVNKTLRELNEYFGFIRNGNTNEQKRAA